MKNKKWLIGCSYNPNKASIAYHLKEISKGIDTYSSDYENIFLMADYNSESSEPTLASFCDLYHLKNLIEEPTLKIH